MNQIHHHRHRTHHAHRLPTSFGHQPKGFPVMVINHANWLLLHDGEVVKPCRCCGGKPDYTEDDRGIRIVCSKRGCVFVDFKKQERKAAIQEWNGPNSGQW
jgi:hypothetical protein